MRMALIPSSKATNTSQLELQLITTKDLDFSVAGAMME
jgi:hypothetical protein